MSDLTLYKKPKFKVSIILDKFFEKKLVDPTIIDVVSVPNPKPIDWKTPLAKYITRLADFFHDWDWACQFLLFLGGSIGAMMTGMRLIMTDDTRHPHVWGIVWIFGKYFLLFALLTLLVVYVFWEIIQAWKWLKKWAERHALHKSEDEWRRRH